jgi:hypothetical protein
MPLDLRPTTFAHVLSLVTTIANSTPNNPAHEEFAFVRLLVEGASAKISQVSQTFLGPTAVHLGRIEVCMRQHFEDQILLNLGWYLFMPPFSRGHIRQYALADYLYNTVVNADASTDIHFPPSSSSAVGVEVEASEIRILESHLV